MAHLADDYLTIDDLSKVLRRPLATIYNQRSRYPTKLPPEIQGTRPLLWKKETVEAWLGEREAQPAQQPRRRGRPRATNIMQ